MKDWCDGGDVVMVAIQWWWQLSGGHLQSIGWCEYMLVQSWKNTGGDLVVVIFRIRSSVLVDVNHYIMLCLFHFQGWTKPNAFHVCITSYKLVVQDHQAFRRKKWKYLILDEVGCQHLFPTIKLTWRQQLSSRKLTRTLNLTLNLSRKKKDWTTKLRHVSLTDGNKYLPGKVLSAQTVNFR